MITMVIMGRLDPALEHMAQAANTVQEAVSSTTKAAD